MTATITQVRDGLKTRLATITGLETFARTPGGGATPPLAVVYPSPQQFMNYGSAMDGTSDDATFLVKLAVAGVESEDAETALDAYLAHSGAASVFAAIEAGQTLGGIVSFARVESVSGYGEIVIGGQAYFGAEVLVSVAL
jgi:hypothetical protein